MATEERMAEIEKIMSRRRSLTEIMRKILGFCKEQRSFACAEEEMATYPEFKYIDQSQASIIRILVQAEALDLIELDARGNVIAPSQKNSLSEDELDDLICSYALKATDAAIAVIGKMTTEKRLDALFAASPDRREAYAGVMNLCRTPQSYEQIESALSNKAPLPSRNDLSDLPVYPSALLAELENAGGLVWNDAWELTDEVNAYLKAHE